MTKLLSTAPALLLEAYTHSRYNLMLVSPIVYSIVDNTLLSNVLDFSLKDCTQLLFIFTGNESPRTNGKSAKRRIRVV